jgi:DNA modification methylase
MPESENTLYYGDNLDVLRRHVADESVDLIYLDPPFNSQQDYNKFFDEQDGSRAAAQIMAFEDTWTWDQAAARAYQEVVEAGGKVSQVMQAFRTFLGENDMLAYLAMMAPRLVELRRILKPTGSIYLHCDPTASHYLKLLMDAVFAPVNFVNDISWKRSQTRSSISRSFRRAHDIILFYSRTEAHQFNMQYKPLSDASLKLYENEDDHGKYQGVPLLVSGKRNGETGKVWRGIDPNTKGKAGMHWVTTPAKLEEYDKKKLILWPDKEGGSPRLKYYLEQSPGVPLSDFWEDIDLISSSAAEALGYPTQKPEALLERIISASGNKGDVILDPFCGCGTAISAAQKLERHWIGIDITHLAIGLIKHRLASAFGPKIVESYKVIGEPVDVNGAAQLAADEPYQFQFWALGLVGARPAEQKKGADKGIDGRLYFHDEGTTAKTKQIIFSVKAGHTGPDHVRDLRGVVDREKAAIGVLITMQEPTQPMRTEAASAGFYKSSFGTQFQKLQVITVGELLNGGRVDMPGWHDSRTFKRAPKAKAKGHTQNPLPFDERSAKPREKL